MPLTLAALALALLGVLRRPPHAWLTLPFAVRLVVLPVLGVPLALVACGVGERLGLGGVRPAAALLAGLALGAWAVRATGPRLQRGPRNAAGPAADGGTAGPELSVVTLNAGLHRADPARLRAWVEARDADLVALQELSDELAQDLEARAPEAFPHVVRHGSGLDSTALLSRHPIRSWRPLGGPLPHLLCELLVHGRELRVIVVHPYFDVAFLGTRSASAADLPEVARLAAEADAALVLGDFNTTDQTPSYDVFVEAGLTDAFRAVGSGRAATFPVPLRYLRLPLPPLVRIDHVFCHPNLEPLSCQVLPDAGSDHLPLAARVRWRATDEGARSARGGPTHLRLQA